MYTNIFSTGISHLLALRSTMTNLYTKAGCHSEQQITTKKAYSVGQVWWHMTAVPAPRKLKCVEQGKRGRYKPWTAQHCVDQGRLLFAE